MTITARTLLSVLLTAMWVAATMALLRELGPDWGLYPPATCRATHCFCELPRTGSLLLQPANSWSSFGFVVVGSWIMLGSRRGSALAGGPALWLGFTAIVIGIGSVLLHATLTLWGQFADVLGMYLLGSFTLVWALVRWRSLTPATAVVIYVALASGLIGLLWLMPETRRWLFAVLLVGAIGVEWWFARPMRPGVRPRLLLFGLSANALAFAIWILDQSRTVCAPGSVVQGHAAWHLLGAFAVACSYAYYRSERLPGSG
ncbi:MAG: ceramidase domain-containing protein [Sandarakinorhabdus sp.]|nr:ceramidase domain-containing protein [Sandarakinorhabdus sp.]